MIAQIIEFFKAAIFFSAVTFVQVNIISWLFAFPISVTFSYIYNHSDVIGDGQFTKDYFVRNWLYMLKLLMKMSLFAGVLITILYYLRQTV